MGRVDMGTHGMLTSRKPSPILAGSELPLRHQSVLPLPGDPRLMSSYACLPHYTSNPLPCLSGQVQRKHSGLLWPAVSLRPIAHLSSVPFPCS